MTEKESRTKKFIEGATGGAVLGAFGSIWILNELETWDWRRSTSHLVSNKGLKIILGSTVAAAAFTGLLYATSKSNEETSWEQKVEQQNTSNTKAAR